jgi:hypothetical protein
MKKAACVLVFLFSGSYIIAQMSRGDSILTNENAIQRPLTLHKNQFRVGLGYDFYIYNSLYDVDGNKEKLSDLGIAVGQTEIPIYLNYGILDFFDISAGFKYASQIYRGLPIAIATSYDIPVSVNEYRYRKGFTDIEVKLNGRVPFKTRKFDLLFMAGIDLPMAGNEPSKPEHTIRTTVIIDTIHNINYNYYDTWGNGTTMYQAGIGFKYRIGRGALNIFSQYKVPSGISESKIWYHRLIDMSWFEYRSEKYKYQLDEILELRIRGEFLLFPWFDITLDIDYFTAGGGWSEVSGKRVGDYDRNELLFVPGYEILATPRFWIRQRITLPISGANTLTSSRIETRLIYNLFVK